MIKLRDYQEEAAYKLHGLLLKHRCAYLSGQVRTGKTFTSLFVIQLLGCEKVLFVTKKKAIPSIQADVDAMSLTEVVTVINFEQVHKHVGKWDMLIVDEAHSIGAYPKPSKRWKDLCRIRYEYVLLQSGTPSPESFSQLYHQWALTPHLWSKYRNFYRWADEYVTVTKKFVGTGIEVNDYSKANKAKVLEAIKPMVVEMTQKEAGFETKIEEQVHTVRMKPRTYRLALRIIRDGVIGRPGLRSVVADSGAKVLQKLRQCYNGFLICEDRERYGEVIWDYSKVEYIKKTFTGRLAIMYCFQAEGKMLRAAFGSRATDSPETFNSDPESVFIGQVQASREGVSLAAADDLVFMGIDYSALSYIQARERCSFLGRGRANRVHYIFAERSIEPRVFEIVKNKQTYTTSHYKQDREQLSVEAHQGIREGRMACNQTFEGQQIGLPGFDFD